MALTLGARTAAADLSERVAICASAACLAHCLLLPLALVLLPSLSVLVTVPESFHLWMIGIAVPSAFFALGLGWRRHRVAVPLVAGTAGLGLLAAGALIVGETAWEAPVTVAGSLALVAAHLGNWRLRHRAGCGCDC